MTDLYILKGKNAPWGDYGNILLNGMTAYSAKEGGFLCLERTGPFIPPISFSGISDIVVTNEFRVNIEKQQFNGFEFREVIKKKIVKLNWESWDQSADEPGEYPAGGEPENYILKRKHSQETSDELGSLWEVALPDVEGLQKEGGAVNATKYQGQDICRASRWGHIYISDRVRVWLENNYGEWVSARRAQITENA